MKTATRKKVVYVALIAALIWGIYNNPFGGKLKQSTPQEEPPAPIEALAAPPPVRGKTISVDLETVPWGADPFRTRLKAASPTAPKTSWKLTGIIYNKEAPLAIINHKPVGVGGTVDNAVVTRIGRHSVTLDHNGRLMQLTVTRG
jgi:hypothetical protein